MTCLPGRMLRRSLLGAVAISLISLGTITNAHAATGLLPSTTTTPVEQRVAVAVGPSRTTLWTSLRADGAKGPLGLVIPVPPGATLDHSSDAWFEALELATAPRVFPPPGASLVCPGEPVPIAIDPFHVTSDLGKTSSLAAAESKVLTDVAGVYAWANANGLVVSANLDSALAAVPGSRFFVEKFNAPGGPFVTSTLRIVLPGQTPVLPLTVTEAGAVPLRVTTWLIGAGRGSLTGSTPLALQTGKLMWKVGTQDSNYVSLRESSLTAAGSFGALTEATSHDSLVTNTSLSDGTSVTTSVITGYFERAASYADADPTFEACITSATAALDSSSNVAESCPRADLGVVDGSPNCAEGPTGTQVDPDKLRCGGRADDLAVALSGLQPANTWVTRTSMLIGNETAGRNWPVTFSTMAPVLGAQLTATSVDYSTCGTSSGSSSSGWNPGDVTSSSSGSVAPDPYNPPNYNSDMACGCAGTAEPIIIDDTGVGGSDTTSSGGGSGGDYYYDDTTSEDCGGDTSDTYIESTSETTYTDSSSEDCGGDTSDTYIESTSDTASSSEDCAGDSSDSYSETTYTDTTYSYTDSSESDSSSDDCGGDTSDSSESSSETSYSDSYGASATWNDSGRADVSHCAVVQRPRSKASNQRGPKASVMTLGLLAILAPLRRLSRPRRAKQQRGDKRG